MNNEKKNKINRIRKKCAKRNKQGSMFIEKFILFLFLSLSTRSVHIYIIIGELIVLFPFVPQIATVHWRNHKMKE